MYKGAEQLKISVKSFSAYLKKKNVNMRFTYKRPNVTFNKNFFEIEICITDGYFCISKGNTHYSYF